VNRYFQAKLAEHWKSHAFKTIVPIPTKFCTAIKTTKYASWYPSTGACVYQIAIRKSCSGLLRHGLNFSRAWWTMRLKACVYAEGGHFKLSLNTCCDVDCLTFNLSCIATDCFQSHQHLKNNIPLSLTWTSSAFHMVVWWHCSDAVGKFTVTVTVRFIIR